MHDLLLDVDNTGAKWRRALEPVWQNLKRLTITEDAECSSLITYINPVQTLSI